MLCFPHRLCITSQVEHDNAYLRIALRYEAGQKFPARINTPLQLGRRSHPITLIHPLPGSGTDGPDQAREGLESGGDIVFCSY